MAGGRIFVGSNKSSEITAVMFAEPDQEGRIKIIAQFYNDPCSYFKILDAIKTHYQETSLTVCRFPEDVKGSLLWTDTNIVPNPDGQALESLVGIETRVYYSFENALPYGMVKILSMDKILEVIATKRKDINLNIILIDGEGRNPKLIEIKNGNSQISIIKDDIHSLKSKLKNCSILSEKDFMEIIFRKKVKEDIIMEAFGIPRLPINISLMLD